MRIHISDTNQGRKKKLYGSTVGERRQRRRDQRAQQDFNKEISGTKSEVAPTAPLEIRKFSMSSYHQGNHSNQKASLDREFQDSDDEISLRPWPERMKLSSARNHFDSSDSYQSSQEDSAQSHSIHKHKFESEHETEKKKILKGDTQSVELWQRRRTRGVSGKADDISHDSLDNTKMMKRSKSPALGMSDTSSISENIVRTQVSRKKALYRAEFDDSESLDEKDECDAAKAVTIRKGNTARSLNTSQHWLCKELKREDENKVENERSRRDSLDFYTQADENSLPQSDSGMSPSQRSCTSSESSAYEASQDITCESKKRKTRPRRSVTERSIDISKTKKSRKQIDLEKMNDSRIKNQVSNESSSSKEPICTGTDLSKVSRLKDVDSGAFDGQCGDCDLFISRSQSKSNNEERKVDAKFECFRRASRSFGCITVTSSIGDVQKAVDSLKMSYLELKQVLVQEDTPHSPDHIDDKIAQVSRDNLKQCFVIMESYRDEMLQLLFTILYHHFQVVSFSQLYDSRAKVLISPSVSMFLSDHTIICKLIDVLIKVTASNDTWICNSLVRDGVSVAVLFSLHMVQKETILEIADASAQLNQSLLERIKNLIGSIRNMFSYSLMEASLLFIMKLRYNVLSSLTQVSRQSVRKQRIEFAKRLSTAESGGSLDLIEHTDPNLPKTIQMDLYNGVSINTSKTFEEWSRGVIRSTSSSVTSFYCNGIYSPIDGNLGTAIARSAMFHVNDYSLSFFVPTNEISCEQISESVTFPQNRVLVEIPFDCSQDNFIGLLNKKERALTLYVDRAKVDGLDMILSEIDLRDRIRICIKVYVRHSEYSLFEEQILQRHGKSMRQESIGESSLSDDPSILTRFSKRALTTKFDGRPETLKKNQKSLRNSEGISSNKMTTANHNIGRSKQQIPSESSPVPKHTTCSKEKVLSTPSNGENLDNSILAPNANDLNDTDKGFQKSIQEVTPLPLAHNELKRRRLRFSSNNSPIDTLVSLCRVLSLERNEDYSRLKDTLGDPTMIDIAESVMSVDEKLLRITKEVETVAHDLLHIADLASDSCNNSFSKSVDLFHSMKNALDEFTSTINDKKKEVEYDFACLMWQKLSA